MKLLGGRYKTYEGARKRAAFENSMAPGEYRRGDKAKLYRYKAVPGDGDSEWRVLRDVAPPVAAVTP